VSRRAAARKAAAAAFAFWPSPGHLRGAVLDAEQRFDSSPLQRAHHDLLIAEYATFYAIMQRTSKVADRFVGYVGARSIHRTHRRDHACATRRTAGGWSDHTCWRAAKRSRKRDELVELVYRSERGGMRRFDRPGGSFKVAGVAHGWSFPSWLWDAARARAAARRGMRTGAALPQLRDLSAPAPRTSPLPRPAQVLDDGAYRHGPGCVCERCFAGGPAPPTLNK